MTSYDHIAAALIVLAVVTWLGWRALDRRIYGPDPLSDAPGDWPRDPRRQG